MKMRIIINNETHILLSSGGKIPFSMDKVMPGKLQLCHDPV